MDEIQAVCEGCGSALEDGEQCCPACGGDPVPGPPDRTTSRNRGRTTRAVSASFVPAARMSTASPVAAGAPVNAQRVLRSGAIGAYPRGSTRSRRRSRPTGVRRALTIVLAVGATLAVVVAVAATVRLSLAGGRPYLSQARAAMRPVVENNGRLTASFAALATRGGARRATISAQATIGALEDAEQRLGTPVPDPADQQFADSAQAAVASELAWLKAVVAVLANPHSPMLAHLGGLGGEAHARLVAIDPALPGTAASLPTSADVIAYAHHLLAGASTRRALTQFDGQVQPIVEGAAPGNQEMNDLLGQIQAAGGGTLHITVAQAQAVIATVVADRTSLAASARGLYASTPLAASVRGALASALTAGVTEDQNLSSCLGQTTRGRFAVVLAGCRAATATSADAAAAAGRNFLALDNELRRQIGEPPTTQQP